MLEVAVGDPLDVVSLDHLRALTGCGLKVWLAQPSEVREAIDEFYSEIRATGKVGEILDKIDLTAATDDDQDVDLATLRQQVEDAPVVRLVNLMLAEAIDARASDIHVEPMRDRIDGPLPHRRHAARGDEAAEEPPDGDRLAHQGARRARHRDPAAAPGRPAHRAPARSRGRHPRLDPAHGARREGGAATVRQAGVRPRDRAPRARGTVARRVPARDPPALRHDPDLGADRERQDHHALLGADRDQDRAQEPASRSRTRSSTTSMP